MLEERWLDSKLVARSFEMWEEQWDLLLVQRFVLKKEIRTESMLAEKWGKTSVQMSDEMSGQWWGWKLVHRWVEM